MAHACRSRKSVYRAKKPEPQGSSENVAICSAPISIRDSSTVLKIRLSLVLVTAFTVTAYQSAAQSNEELVQAFSGDWYAFDAGYGTDGKLCKISLGAEAETTGSEMYPITVANCAEPISAAVGWRIEDGQLAIAGSDQPNTPLGTLGGTQFRLSGSFAHDTPVILERASGGKRSQELAEALKRHRCYYGGYSETCVAPANVGAPEIPGEDGPYASVNVLVNLRVRAEPRPDAGIIGRLAENTCLKVNTCLSASDGIWCRARFGDRTGWISKHVLRLDEWPVVTFENSCPN